MFIGLFQLTIQLRQLLFNATVLSLTVDCFVKLECE